MIEHAVQHTSGCSTYLAWQGSLFMHALPTCSQPDYKSDTEY